ncbi:hypothetical protein BHM03_00001418 [Ensete ventricosum]|nr:hypothetical protein BHM03_00001418 [Ensete ventricosum]
MFLRTVDVSKLIRENMVLAYWMSSASEFCDLELCLGGRLLEWWSPGEEGVLQYGSAADSCKKVGSGRSFYSGCCRSFVPDDLTAFMAYYATVPSTMLAALAMRCAFARGGCRPYLCHVGCTTTDTPRISDWLPASDRPCRWASCPRV